MSLDIKKKTRIIKTTDSYGHIHECKVFNLLMWSATLRGINDERTVAMRRKRDYEERVIKREAS